MNNENSKRDLTQSQNEGRNIDELTVAEAQALGYKLLNPLQAEIYNFGLKKVKDTVKNTNFENTSSSKANPVRVKA